MLSFKPKAGMVRADLYYIETVKAPQAVLVLAPGCNGNGKILVEHPTWQEFAKKMNIGLVGLSFASNLQDLHNGKGYYYASNGSGDILLAGINKLYKRDIPLLLYGFSGGAHFISRFVDWAPKRVIAWCAYSAMWWDNPTQSNIYPPGIIACGESDSRLGASLIYFKQGRAIGKPWLWICIPNNAHSANKKVEAFVRDYFEIIIADVGNADFSNSGIWVDIDTGRIAETYIKQLQPSITAWMPDPRLLEAWRSLNGYK